jgi:phospholipid/cholesterol/gamma-HCH transport system ATP-binding protein
MSDSTTDMIEFIDVHKSFDSKEVLTGLTLAIRRGETLVILGRSGCGKSVMLKILLGLIPADSGEIYIDGQEIAHLAEKSMLTIRRMIGMLFQGSALFDSLTVGENVAYALREHTKMTDREIREIVNRNLEFVELPDTANLMPAELSGGMRKRVALARAMVYQPRILLYDEPTTGLDPITATTINALIRKTRQEHGVTSIVVTHELDSGFSVADRIAVIDRGKIIEVGSKESIRNSKNDFVRTFIAGPK